MIWVRIGSKGEEALRMGQGGTNGRTDGRMDGQTDGWTDGRTDSPCVLQDFVPFGAAALLPLNLNHTLLKQGTGTADHLLPLGCYLGLHHAQGHIFSLFLLSFTLLRLHSKILKVLEEKSYYS